MARGKVLAYLNSDDLYLPWSVETALNALKDGVDLVYGDLGILVKRDRRSRFFPQFYPPFDLGYYTYYLAPAQPTVFWKRGLTESIGPFDPSYRLAADKEYWLRAASRGAAFAHVDEILAIQIEHPETLRASHPDRLEEEFSKIRSIYSKVAGPPKFRRWRFKNSIRWRYDHLQFLINARRATPNRWPRFMAHVERKRHRIIRQVEEVVSASRVDQAEGPYKRRSKTVAPAV